jgi:DNA-binding transcriptional MerR regulator
MVNKHKRYVIKNIYNKTGGYDTVFYCPSQIINYSNSNKSIIEIISDLANKNISLEEIKQKYDEYKKIPDSSNVDMIKNGSTYESKAFEFLIIEDILSDEIIEKINKLDRILKEEIKEKYNYTEMIEYFFDEKFVDDNFINNYALSDKDKFKLDNLSTEDKNMHLRLRKIIDFLKENKLITKKITILLEIIFLSRMLENIKLETIKKIMEKYFTSTEEYPSENNLSFSNVISIFTKDDIQDFIDFLADFKNDKFINIINDLARLLSI